MKHNLKKSATSIFCLLFCAFLLSCNRHSGKKNVRPKTFAGSVSSNRADTTSYKVIGIKDGDTFVLLMDGEEQTIRLAHIDCPEKNQPFGNKAKQFASDLCFGKSVTLIHNNRFDRYRRLIAEVILQDGRIVNMEMVKNGFAWHFKKYSGDAVYAQLEIEARDNKSGLWRDIDPAAPWAWRKR